MRRVEFKPEEFLTGLEATSIGLPANAPLTPWEVARLRVLFDRYVAQGARGDLLTSARYFRSGRGKAIKEAYAETYKGGRLVELRIALKRLVANRCPCCGGARPGQLDHHLPKSEYQEFSLLPANLVASCGECNNTKRINIGTSAETALLHPYFDEIPLVPFIKVTLELEAKYVLAAVAFDDDAAIADPVIKARLKNHFDVVDVNARLESEITELILETGAAIVEADLNPRPETVVTTLTTEAEKKAAFFGAACWHAAVLRALAADADYCSGGYLATRKTQIP